MNKQVKNLQGRQFSQLLVLSFARTDARRKAFWLCRCLLCETEKEFRADTLKKLVNCGCDKTSVVEKRRETNRRKFGTDTPAQSQIIKDKMRETIRERYGTDSVTQTEMFKQKTKQTYMNKYGVEWGVQASEIKQKIAATNLSKFGVKNPMQSDVIQKKAQETNIKKYGTPYPSQNHYIKQKTQGTNISRYGVSSTFQDKIIKEKIQQTMLRRYGVEYPLQSQTIKETVKKTTLSRYGVEHAMQNHTIRDRQRPHFREFRILLEDPEYLKKRLQTENAYQIAETLGISDTTVSRYARLHGINDGFRSNLERSVSEWLDTLGLEFRTDRSILSGYEIDRFCQTKMIGIEINGLSSHSEILGSKDKHYHKWKLDRCKEKGIHLITIFEDEWYYRQDAVKTVITTQLGLQTKGCGARQLSITSIEPAASHPFFERYHVQGSSRFSYVVGAFHDNEMVAAMAFGHPTRQSKYQHELKRYCTSGRIHAGVASRMFQYFIHNVNPVSVVTFCDNRFFVGKSYSSMGFMYDGEISPDYQYTDDYRTRHHKSKFRLSRLQKLFEDTQGKTEWQIMRENGYDRIWDCGKSRYVWRTK